MALNVTPPVPYGGADTNLLIEETLRETNMVQRAGARVLQGFKSKAVWGILDVDACLGAYELCSTTIQDFTYQEKARELTRFQANFQVNHDALVATFRETRYRQGQLVGSFLDDTEVRDKLMDLIQRKLTLAANSLLMKGGSYYSLGDGCVDLDTMDGVIALLNGNVNTPKISAAGSTTVATSPTTGVFARIDAALEALPDNLKFSTDAGRKVKVFCAPDVGDAIQKSIHQIGGNSYFVGITQGGSPQFIARQPIPSGRVADGLLEYVILPEIPASKFYITWPENVGVFFDDATDLSNIIVVDGRTTIPICDYVQMRVNARMGVDIFRPEEAVLAI